MSITVGLIVTVYDKAPWLEECLVSIQNQTFTNWVCVIVNDGSTDDSTKIIEPFVEKDSRFNLITNDYRLGAWKSANIGYKALPNCPYIGQVDGDDFIEHDCLEKCVQALDNMPSHVGVAYTLYWEKQGDDVKLGWRNGPGFDPRDSLQHHNAFHFRLIKRHYLDMVGAFQTEMFTAYDYDLVLKLGEVCNFVHVPYPLYTYRIVANSLSHTEALDQLRNSQLAIAQAIRRRGLQDVFLNMQLYPEYWLSRHDGEVIHPRSLPRLEIVSPPNQRDYGTTYTPALYSGEQAATLEDPE